jgi:ribosome biogenesis GTPase
MRKKGLVVKKHSNIMIVEDRETHENVSCKLRGKFKIQGIIPYVGDVVEYTQMYNEGVIEAIQERRNFLTKPTISNVDTIFVIATIKDPMLHRFTLDRFLALAESVETDMYIVFNKIDLLDEKDQKELDRITEIYNNSGYDVLWVSAKTGEGIEDIKNILKDRINVFAGMSGVGKSSLLNALDPNLRLRTGDLTRIRRGGHTTTFSQLLKFEFGGYIADTPGFSNLKLDTIPLYELKYLFPEFRYYSGKCKYVDCTHIHEDGCFIKKLVVENKIDKVRYENYVKFYKEVERKSLTKRSKWEKKE